MMLPCRSRSQNRSTTAVLSEFRVIFGFLDRRSDADRVPPGGNPTGPASFGAIEHIGKAALERGSRRKLGCDPRQPRRPESMAA